MSSGLLDRLGIAGEVKPKAKLIHGGAVAEHIAKGEAEVGIHQISEILPVKGITLVGPLPADIQNYTVYAVGVGANAKQARSRQGADQGAVGTGRRRRAEIERDGRGRIVSSRRPPWPPP